ncbi:MAG TPA: GNAT family N-acetyltransferase [Solirubrobacteraceae bacterium]|nr:GNAT family N-acetyltransferase [Solirubrobacteraceae bacterium]
MPTFPDLTPPLSDGVIELREASEWDIPDILIAHQDDPQLYRSVGLIRVPSGAELGRWMEREPAERAAGSRLRLTIVEPGQRTCRGQIDIHNVSWTDRRAELGIWLAPRYRGRGLAGRALRLTAAWLTDRCGLQRLCLITEPGNRAMLGAARAAGFMLDPLRTDDAAGPVRLCLTAAAARATGPDCR